MINYVFFHVSQNKWSGQLQKNVGDGILLVFVDEGICQCAVSLYCVVVCWDGQHASIDSGILYDSLCKGMNKEMDIIFYEGNGL